MSTAKKIKRNYEKKVMKKRIDELLDLLELKESEWNDLNFRVEGKGLEVKVSQKYFNPKDPNVKWGRHKKGKTLSLKNQFSILWDLWTEKLKNKELLDELKAKMDEIKEGESENGRTTTIDG